MKKGLFAQERARADIRLARFAWTVRCQPFMRQRAQRLVFIDKTSVKTNMTRLCGRSAIDERLFVVAPFGRWQTQTFIAGLTCGALIAPWVIGGAMDRAAFDIYFESQLAPALVPGCRDPRQPVYPQKPAGSRDTESPWLPDTFHTRLLVRPHSDRDDLLNAESISRPHRRKNL